MRTQPPIGSHIGLSKLTCWHQHRSVSATSTSLTSWDALASELASPPGAIDPRAASAAVARADLRVDEWLHPSGVATFWLLRHSDTSPDGAASFDPALELGMGANEDVLASVVQQDAVLYGMKTRSPVPATIAARLVHAAAEKQKKENGTLTALVALPRLCAWVRDGARWNDPDVISSASGEAREAAEAIALGRPREGHSVLGRGTFAAAEPAWMSLAEKHMEEDSEVLGEIMAYKTALPGAFRAAHMADGDPEYLAVAGGAMAVLSPPAAA
jgi:hypothetical protein